MITLSNCVDVASCISPVILIVVNDSRWETNPRVVDIAKVLAGRVQDSKALKFLRSKADMASVLEDLKATVLRKGHHEEKSRLFRSIVCLPSENSEVICHFSRSGKWRSRHGADGSKLSLHQT